MIRIKVIVGVVAVLAMVIFISGCSQQNTALKKMEADNMALVRHVHEEVGKGNVDVFDEALAENYVRHCQAMPPEDQAIQQAPSVVMASPVGRRPIRGTRAMAMPWRLKPVPS